VNNSELDTYSHALFFHNDRYYRLAKYWPFHLNHPVYKLFIIQKTWMLTWKVLTQQFKFLSSHYTWYYSHNSGGRGRWRELQSGYSSIFAGIRNRQQLNSVAWPPEPRKPNDSHFKITSHWIKFQYYSDVTIPGRQKTSVSRGMTNRWNLSQKCEANVTWHSMSLVSNGFCSAPCIALYSIKSLVTLYLMHCLYFSCCCHQTAR
jgi:hypothetical protein